MARLGGHGMCGADVARGETKQVGTVGSNVGGGAQPPESVQLAVGMGGASDVRMEKTACVLRGDPVCSWRRVGHRIDERSSQR